MAINRYALFFLTMLLSGALSCARQADSASGDPFAVALLFSSDGASKVDALVAGDAVGVFARIDGRETYGLENHKFRSTSTGTLTGDPAAYYPDSKQATRLYAYYPYLAGTGDGGLVAWRTPMDQTALADYRHADLLWGEAITTPVAEAVPVGFAHLLSRVAIEVHDELGVLLPLERVALHQVLTDGVLDATTGLFVAAQTRKNVEAAGRNELVVPSQSITQFTFQVGVTEYTFLSTAPIVLDQGKSHTLHLTLRQASQTPQVVLDRVSTDDWVISSGAGQVQHRVHNTITAHWLLPHPDFATATKILLHVVDGVSGANYSVPSLSYAHDPTSSGSVGAATFTIEAVEGLSYPFKIESIDFLRPDGSVVQSCPTLTAQGIYRSGAVSFGIYQDHILLVTTDPITAWDEVLIPGGFDDYKYQGNTFVVKAVNPPFEWGEVHTVRFKIWNGMAEWRGLDLAQVPSNHSLLTATGVFTFPDSNGYLPELRHYPIEYVELADAGGGYLYRGYCQFEVAETGQIVLWLYPDGAVQTPGSSLVRPIGVTVEGSVDNMKFSQNRLDLRFFNCFFDTKAVKTVHLMIGTTEYVWDFTAAKGANDLLFFGSVIFPDKRGSKPNNAYYHISTIELRDSKGGVPL